MNFCHPLECLNVVVYTQFSYWMAVCLPLRSIRSIGAPVVLTIIVSDFTRTADPTHEIVLSIRIQWLWVALILTSLHASLVHAVHLILGWRQSCGPHALLLNVRVSLATSCVGELTVIVSLLDLPIWSTSQGYALVLRRKGVSSCELLTYLLGSCYILRWHQEHCSWVVLVGRCLGPITTYSRLARLSSSKSAWRRHQLSYASLVLYLLIMKVLRFM